MSLRSKRIGLGATCLGKRLSTLDTLKGTTGMGRIIMEGRVNGKGNEEGLEDSGRRT